MTQKFRSLLFQPPAVRNFARKFCIITSTSSLEPVKTSGVWIIKGAMGLGRDRCILHITPLGKTHS